MRVFVTGRAGSIGSHACKALALAGHESIVLDGLRTGHRGVVNWCPRESADIRDREAVSAVMKKHRPNTVMHFAALANVGKSMAQQSPYSCADKGMG